MSSILLNNAIITATARKYIFSVDLKGHMKKQNLNEFKLSESLCSFLIEKKILALMMAEYICTTVPDQEIDFGRNSQKT